ncbi:MAG: zinc ABC transporter substrate-binding protein [Myxococcales bacterium]|nr:zinc ABC transporter substrate-binding protein [Myxococcales bacterium]
MRVLALILALTALACADRDGEAPAAAEPEAPLSVYVVNYPLQYFAERIGGEQVAVTFPAPPGSDPAFWSPSGETVAAYQRADVVLLNGAGYAKWVGRASLPRAGLVDTSASFRDRWIPLTGSVSHTHGPEGAHAHRGWAFTTWLDPTLAALQARAITDAFARARPAHEAAFRGRFAALAEALAALDSRLAAAAEALDGAPLLFSHPVYDYLIRRYELNARSVHWEPDESPTPAMWRVLEELLTTFPARCMLWEAEPLAETKERLLGLGVRSAVYAPLGDTPENSDFLSGMQENADRVEAIARSPEATPVSSKQMPSPGGTTSLGKEPSSEGRGPGPPRSGVRQEAGVDRDPRLAHVGSPFEKGAPQ